MIYLDGEEVLRLHKIVIDFAGGSHGVRDAKTLLSVLLSPNQTFSNTAVYSDVWTKAAVYMEKFAQFHVFVDGNKRMSLVTTTRFLYLNGYRLVASNAEAEHFIVKNAV